VENLWVGNSQDEETAEVDMILNVARDLRPTRGYPKVEYCHVGLVDGPGNPMTAYCAAILALATLKQVCASNWRILVCCHEGKSRSLAVAVMYLALMGGRSWDEQMTILRERIEDVPTPHEAHKDMFNLMDRLAMLDVLE
jgi:protein-tyrosine phosphatase